MIIKYIDLLNKEKLDDEISLCLGYFDGIHKGHITLINQALNSTYKSGLLTLINFNKRNEILTSLEDKIKILKTLNIDYLFLLPFDVKIKNLSPDEFIKQIILKLNPKEIIVGNDYTFGKNKSGNILTLKKYSDYKLIIMPFVYFHEEKISTTFILKKLEEGRIDIVNSCLLNNYKISAKVIHGKGNGHKFNFPTANLNLEANYKLPKNGVYKGYTFIDNQKYLSMINVGTHPTISELKKPIIEVHLVDTKIDMYGKHVEVEFVSYIRDEKKFSSVEELITQLTNDQLLIKNL